jgi:DnaJ family protein A protein 3
MTQMRQRNFKKFLKPMRSVFVFCFLIKCRQILLNVQILGDETKRKQFDTWGATSEQMGGMGGGGPHSGHQGFAESWQYQSSIDPEELFRKIFGEAGFGRSTGFDDFAESSYGFGQAQEVIVKLTFTQAARGTNKDLTVNVVDTCPKCQGSRCELGTKATRCTHCDGTGMESVTRGPFIMRSTCRYCQGTRMFIKHKCVECEGKGSTVQRKKITVPVPAGIFFIQGVSEFHRQNFRADSVIKNKHKTLNTHGVKNA